jgi:hypothetical protein
LAPAAEISRRLARTTRDLNQATNPADGFPGLCYPSDVYETLACLALTADRLRLAVRQLAVFLRTQLDAGHIRIDPGTEFEDDPAAAVNLACAQLLAGAQPALANLAAAFETAQQAIAHAGTAGPNR